MAGWIRRRILPHWRADGATYFVTWCLHRSQAALTSDERGVVFEIVRHFDHVHFDLSAVVVMDDHVHVVVTPYPNQPLERLIQSWKARSAARFRQGIRVAPFWQRGYYDRIIRSPSDLEEKVRYVAMNPAKRWLGVVHYPWLWVGAEPARALTGRGHHG